jgi:hypothetical protein
MCIRSASEFDVVAGPTTRLGRIRYGLHRFLDDGDAINGRADDRA